MSAQRASRTAWRIHVKLRMSLIAICLISPPPVMSDGHHQLLYGLGHTPSEELLKEWDIAIGPDGNELPQGRGTVAAGAALYLRQCAMCHGANGHEGPDPVLVGGHGTLASDAPLRTIGSYWPFATTLYDYIYRAMPFLAPASLGSDEVYALCAFLLHTNGIIGADAVMDQRTLPAVKMPNREGFIADPRPDTGAPPG
jgi:hypothetical protein